MKKNFNVGIIVISSLIFLAGITIGCLTNYSFVSKFSESSARSTSFVGNVAIFLGGNWKAEMVSGDLHIFRVDGRGEIFFKKSAVREEVKQFLPSKYDNLPLIREERPGDVTFYYRVDRGDNSDDLIINGVFDVNGKITKFSGTYKQNEEIAAEILTILREVREIV